MAHCDSSTGRTLYSIDRRRDQPLDPIVLLCLIMCTNIFALMISCTVAMINFLSAK